MKSTHQTNVVRVKLEKHPNADTLSVVKVNGYTTIVKTEEWKDGDLGIYVLPDSCVPKENSLFTNVKTKSNGRVTASKIRGMISYGVLVKALPDMQEGQEVSEELGITHYDPEGMRGKGSNLFSELEENAPPFTGKYDVESFLTYGEKVFISGEPVVLTEN